MAQRAPGKEIFDEEASDRVEFPTIPRDTDVTNSPGTTLAYRLPIAVTTGWQLFAAAVGCLCWNGLVALFAFLAVRKRRPFDLVILVEGHTGLRNPYGVLLVDPKRNPGGNVAGARKLMEWMTSARGQALIGAFRVDGEALFHPNAKP